MSKAAKVIIGLIVIAAVIVGIVAFTGKSNNTTNKQATATTTTPNNKPPATTKTPASASTAAPTTSQMAFTIHANDSSADQEVVKVPKGSPVSITFSVDNSGVYHGGLQFKSTDPAIDSGPIDPGESKTVSFTADHSFAFTPYWYASQVKKDYQIQVETE